MHPPQNPIWEALGGVHARFALASSRARRYAPEVGPFFAVRDPLDPACWDALATLVPVGATTRTWVWGSLPDVGSKWRIRETPEIRQMVHEGSPRIAPGAVKAVRLDAGHAGEMLELATLAAPGPFERRTVELGDYLGVRDAAGRLVAMAGERVRAEGWTEISAVCTHPDHRGQGLAARLVMRLVAAIHARGEAAFLHVRGANGKAQALYERLGFVERRRGSTLVLERADA